MMFDQYWCINREMFEFIEFLLMSLQIIIWAALFTKASINKQRIIFLIIMELLMEDVEV